MKPQTPRGKDFGLGVQVHAGVQKGFSNPESVDNTAITELQGEDLRRRLVGEHPACFYHIIATLCSFAA